MPSTEWLHFAPHNLSPEGALQKLREQAFRDGAYVKPSGFSSMLKKLSGGGKATSIEAALQQAGGKGTHSILDIIRVSLLNQSGAAAPLSEERMQQAFGTPQPTRAQVESGKEMILDYMEPPEAVYFPVYENGQPREWAFLGCTGE